MPKANANGIDIYYELHGSGDALVLIPGYTCDLSVCLLVLESLAKKFQVVLFDNRGVGRTSCPKGPYSVEMMAKDVMGLVDHLNLKRYHLLGHSLGGAIAQRVAHDDPKRVQKLIIANSTPKFSPICLQSNSFFLKLREQQLPDELLIPGFMPWLFSRSFLSVPENIKNAVDRRLQNPCRQDLIGQTGQFGALASFDSRKWLNKIQTPTLILAGEEDLLCPLSDAHALKSGIPNSKLHIFPGQGHAPLLEQPQVFAQVVTDFI